MADTQTLFDTLAGAFSPGGVGINRPALNSAVAGAQSLNGLRSAQTDEAWQTADQKRAQMSAQAGLGDKLVALGYKPEEAAVIQAQVQGGVEDKNDLFSSLTGGVKYGATRDLANPALLNTPTQTAAQQGIKGEVAPLKTVPDQFAVLPGQTAPDVHVSPLGVADIHMKDAMGNLHQTQADAGGWNPHANGVAALPQEQQDGITRAIQEHRLDPSKVNSRNAGIFGAVAAANPGYDFNHAMAEGASQRNPTQQNKFMAMDSLPGVLSHLTSLGKQVGYNDLSIVGRGQKWLMDETNAPELTEYMTVRNDAILQLANVMRGVGMSDKATAMEDEALKPTLAPYALDAWLKGQMSVLKPRLAKFRALMDPTHISEDGSIPTPPGAAGGIVPPQTIKGDADYEALPSGAEFIGPDGIHRKKP